MVKLLVGVLAVTAIAVSSGFAAAHTSPQPQIDLTGYTKEQCKNGGWKELGFKNQGECVSYFARGGVSVDESSAEATAVTNVTATAGSNASVNVNASSTATATAN